MAFHHLQYDVINMTYTEALCAPANPTCEEGCADNPVSQKEQISLAVKILYGVLLVAIFAVSAFGNSIVCLIVFKKPSMRSAINLLLATLALSHILLVLTCLPFAFTTLITDEWVLGEVMCKLTAGLHMLLVCSSALILTAISVDRYLIIVMRKDKLTSQKANVLISILWLLSLGVAVPPCFGWGLYVSYPPLIQCTLQERQSGYDMGYIAIAYIIAFFAPGLTMTFCYLRIYHKVRMNLRQIANYPAVVNTATAIRLGLQLSSAPPPPNVDMSFKTRAYKTILILFVIYVVCWLPYSVCFITWNLRGTVHEQYTWGSFIIIVGYLNTAVNPLIYFWRIRKFKEACAELMPKLSKWIPGLKVRTRRRINPSRAYQVTEVATVSQQSMTQSM